jgi:hypothetical protein
MTKLAKGQLVKLNDIVCFTTRNGGGRNYPLTNWHTDNNGTIQTSRPITQEEEEAWYNSEASKGMTDAGETKLPPRSVAVDLHRGRVYQVLRARCRAQLGWGNPTPGLAMVLCTHTGEETYIKRELLEVA